MVPLDRTWPDALPSIVLLVDTDADALANYSTYFEASGLWVATSPSPVEALEAVHELKPDLVITDVFDVDGVTMAFIDGLKAGADTRGIPLILLSRAPLTTVPIEARRGADLCLEKPVLADVLLHHSRAVIAKARAQREHEPDPRADALERAARSATIVEGTSSPKRREGACPECGAALDWIERSRLFGTNYEYYRWCAHGCGLFCFNLDAGSWVKLA